MKTQRRALRSEFYDKVFRLRAGGAQPYEIAARLNVPEAEVLKALEFMVEGYRNSLELAGKHNLFVEQAMAIEVSMAQLSSLLKEATRPVERAQIIRLREELRKDWLKMLATVGLADEVKGETFFGRMSDNLSDDDRMELIQMALKRLAEVKRDKEVGGGEQLN